MTTWRSRRGHEVQPEEGEQYKDSALRRFSREREIAMFPFNMVMGSSRPPRSEPSKEQA